MFDLFITSKTEKRGAVLPVTCPRCAKTDFFDLHVVSGGMMLFGVIPLVKSGEMGVLKCRHCTYEINLKRPELATALELNRHALQYEAGKISQAEFVRLAKPLRLEGVAVVMQVQATAKCPACHEEVPGTFARCWNCNTEIPGAVAASGAGDDETKPGDQEEASPFGGMRL